MSIDIIILPLCFPGSISIRRIEVGVFSGGRHGSMVIHGLVSFVGVTGGVAIMEDKDVIKGRNFCNRDGLGI